MTTAEYRFLVYSDLYRITGRYSAGLFLRHLLLGEGFKYSFWMRTCAYLSDKRFLKFSCYPVARLMLRHYRYKFGISIPSSTQIGSGFHIAHFGTIVVNARAAIGKNCSISHGVSIGRTNRVVRKGFPTIGDNVYIGPGAKINGKIHIGDNSVIGANCVVAKDIPANSVVVGIPGEVISDKGSIGYINRTDY